MCSSDLAYLEEECDTRLAEMKLQREQYRAVRPRLELTRRTVILVDDGLATGATMEAAVQTTRLAKPESMTVAVPVGPPETIARLARECPVVCPLRPAWFEGVGQFYEDFTQVTDEEVVGILKEFA